MCILVAALAVPLSLIAGPAVQAAVAQDGSTAVMTPASGAPGTTVKATGENWTPGDHIQAEWGDNDSNLGSPVVVASDGTFTDSFAIPSDATVGSHQVLFWDQEGQYFEVANFDVTSGSAPPPSSCPAPSVSFLPAGGTLGTTFVIAGSNWVPGGTVSSTLPYGSPGIFTGYQTPTVGTNGGFNFKETVGTGPGGPTPPGTYTFTFVEKYGGCSLSYVQKFTVTSKPSPPGCTYAPKVTFSPSSGRVGTTFTITGSRWVPGGTVTSTLPHGSPGWFTGYRKPTVNAHGGFSYKEKVGTGPHGRTPPGTYTFTYVENHHGCSLSVRQKFTVTPRNPRHRLLATDNLPYVPQYQRQPDQNCDCGVADAAMVIVAYGKHASYPAGQWGPFLEKIRAASGNTAVCSDLDFGQLEAALSAWSLTYTEISKSLSADEALAQIKAAVDVGKPVIALVEGTDLTTNPQGPLGSGQQPGRGFGYGAHFVLVKAVSGTTVTFNDPDNQINHHPNVTPYWLPGGENTTLGVGQFEKALADVNQSGQPYAISVGDGIVGG